MEFRVAGFDWDDGNQAKCQKHGLSVAEIESFFARSPRVAPDIKHSLGRSLHCRRRTKSGRPLFVAFALRITDRGRLIRPLQSMKKTSPMRVPRLKTDQQAEAFLAKDLSNLDFSRFKLVPSCNS